MDAGIMFGITVVRGKLGNIVLCLYCERTDCHRSRLKGHDRIPEAFSIAWGLIHDN